MFRDVRCLYNVQCTMFCGMLNIHCNTHSIDSKYIVCALRVCVCVCNIYFFYKQWHRPVQYHNIIKLVEKGSESEQKKIQVSCIQYSTYTRLRVHVHVHVVMYCTCTCTYTCTCTLMYMYYLFIQSLRYTHSEIIIHLKQEREYYNLNLFPVVIINFISTLCEDHIVLSLLYCCLIDYKILEL